MRTNRVAPVALPLLVALFLSPASASGQAASASGQSGPVFDRDAAAVGQEAAGRSAARQSGADSLLQSGPMVGYSTMREVLLWAQTTRPARVHFTYRDTASNLEPVSTDTVLTRESEAFTAKLRADRVQPGRTYRYELYVDGERVERSYPLRFQTQELWQWRRDPPPFRMAVGSCAYVNEERYDRPGEPYGSDYEVFTAIHEKRPDVMLWLGDNTYLREADWNSRTGILHRYTHTRSLEELQPLLASTHHYAIWDDHDYGPNNSNRSWWNKAETRRAFRLFWGNPSFGVEGVPGVTTTFRWADVQFFLLDDRWNRAPEDRVTGARTMLGEEQVEWLVDALASSAAPFKVVALGSQFLNPLRRFETYADDFPAERERILDLIRAEDIDGVMFLTGDRHFTELRKFERRGTYPIYDLTVSPLTAGVNTYGSEEPEYTRVPGTVVEEHNFAILEVTGPREDRVLAITVYDKDGEERWTREIRARELRN